MRFRILGPVEAWHDGRQLAIGGPQQRALLAVLLLDANRVVSASRLIAEIWGERSSADARVLLRSCVARLRRALGPSGSPGRLVTRDGGYLLVVGPGELDLHAVEELDAAAGAARAEGGGEALDRASRLLSEALALWRGPALEGIAPGVCQAHATRLEEQRLALFEQRVDVDLELGRHHALVGELRLQVRAHPLRERLWAQLMVALYAADRQVDALAAYRQVRRHLVEQLGVDPGPTLREIERAILRGADVLDVYRRGQAAPAGGVPVAPLPKRGLATVPPAQLPAAAAAFTGRREHIERLDALRTERTERAEAVVISAIAGTAGVGKTALAVHWAHQVRDVFPDGQLYVDLRGYAPTPPLRPIDALAGFLRGLGVAADDVPADTDEAAALYRSLLAERRVLVLLDNARSAEQVRPLLPGGAGCLALVTSRDRLGGLVAREGAHRVTLDVLSPDESRALLVRLLGPDRAGAEPQAVADLATACAHLPLALRIASAALADDPHRTVAGYVTELVEGNRLQALTADDEAHSAVRATLDLSYTTLPASARRLFRLLGLVPGPDFTADAAAALLAVDVAAARPLLDRLAAAHLVARRSPGRYAFHDLLRLHAAAHAEAEDSHDERRTAGQRLLDWYLATADSADRRLYPGHLRLTPPPAEPTGVAFATDAEALAWLDAEWSNLVAGVRHAAAHGARPTAVLLADALRAYVTLRVDVVDGLTLAETALAAAEAEGDRHGEAAGALTLGTITRTQGDCQQALQHFDRAARTAKEAPWPQCQAVAVGNIGVVHRQLGHLHEAIEHLSQALTVIRQAGWTAGEATCLSNLGTIYLTLGRLDPAADCFARVLEIDRETGYRIGEAIDLSDLGEVHHIQGRLDRATEYLSQAVQLVRTLGDPGSEASIQRMLAEVHRDAGRYPQAYEAVHAAMSVAHGLRERRYEADTLNAEASIDRRRGRYARAAGLYRRALHLAQEIGAEQTAVAARVGLAVVHRHLGRVDSARAHAEEAVTLAHRADYRMLEGRALTALADSYQAGGQPERARPPAQRAVELHRASGYRLGQAHALVVLGHAHRDTGNPDAATARWREALELFTAIGTPEANEIRAVLDAHASASRR